MSASKWDQHVMNTLFLSPRQSAADGRAAAAEREAEELNRRRVELLQLTAAATSPRERIRLWETRFGLALPRDPGHPLVARIAEATQLTRADVLHEQRERRA
jgi:hypothetical protein